MNKVGRSSKDSYFTEFMHMYIYAQWKKFQYFFHWDERNIIGIFTKCFSESPDHLVVFFYISDIWLSISCPYLVFMHKLFVSAV